MQQQSELKSPGKRAFTTFIDDDHFGDSENADPAFFSVKKTMMFDGGVAKRTPARFNILVDKTKSLQPLSKPVPKTPTPSTPRPFATPKSPSSRWNERLCDYQPPFGMYSRPAGRSPASKQSSDDNGRTELCKPMTTSESTEHFGIIAAARSIDEMLSAIPAKATAVTAADAATPKARVPAAAAAATVRAKKRYGPRAEPVIVREDTCLLYTSPSPRDRTRSRMPSSA